MPRRWLALVFVVLAAGPGLAQPEDEPPVRNRPARFSGAVGSFDIHMDIDPSEVHGDQAVTLTVRIEATGPVREPPSRPNLRDLNEFTERFYIENLPGPDDHPEEQAAGGGDAKGPWVFRYRLRPRSAQVDAVPSLPFVFYRPARPGSGGRGSYQTIYAERKPLTIKPTSAALPPTEGAAETAPPAPPGVYDIVEGAAVLRRRSPWDAAGPVLAALVLAGVPALCVGWYLLWRRRYPDAARVARQRRSRAARQALKALYGLRGDGGAEQARKAAVVVTAYLRERVDLPSVAPTADEAAAYLRNVGVPDGAGKVAQFFHAVDAARFAPEPPSGPGDWAGTAEALILTLEAEPCLSPAS
jgi:hypothetical protein